jgi:hypothetical protein
MVFLSVNNLRTKMAAILFSLIVFAVWTQSSHAQLQTDSNTIRTRVGNPAVGTAPEPPQDIRQGLIDTFGVTMNGFDQDHLRWTWERLWEVSHTKFTGLIRGSRVEATSGLSSQVGCFGGGTTLNLGQYAPREFFKFIVLHEFGHVIQSCHPRSVSNQVAQQNAFATEGGISYYATNAGSCTGSNSLNEDYADMIAYHLDRIAGFSSGPGGGRCGPSNPPNPYEGSGFGLHQEAARGVLD